MFHSGINHPPPDTNPLKATECTNKTSNETKTSFRIRTALKALLNLEVLVWPIQQQWKLIEDKLFRNVELPLGLFFYLANLDKPIKQLETNASEVS